MSIFASKKDQLCKDMDVVYHGLHNASEARLQYAKGWEDFGKTSAIMLTSQIPELETQFQELEKLFTEVANIHRQLAQEESRNAEDFRDVIERFSVVYRVSEEYSTRKQQWKEACDNFDSANKKIEIEKLKGTYQKNQAKLEANLAAAKKEKSDFLRRIKRKCQQLIDEKNKYNKFKIRRFRSGWTRYSNALKVASEAEIDVYGRIRDYLSQLNIENPEAAKVAEAAVNEQLSKPAPGPAPIPNHEEETNEEHHDAPEEHVEAQENQDNQENQEDAEAQPNDGVPAEPLFDNFE
ncbi:hypothetical protein M9Y10_032775 [Tritrichomonas musculus]|uniref:Uncharacterized protein n=1 Tax=Tritrichomonas musculus TaxID=1915356 RepID=A0ABR2GK65_9EUKA